MNLSAAEVSVDLGSRRYVIKIGSNILGSRESYAGLDSGGDCAIVCNPTVLNLSEEKLRAALAGRYRAIHTIVTPEGEEHKDWSTLQGIFDALLAKQCGRDTTIFALGGGVTGDVAGFAAACYMRGVPYVQVPTTLLAQVDSAVGGKTAINHPLGKNMIGAFHQPERVIVDIDTLSTLPKREMTAGLAEIIKYGVIADDEFLDWIDVHLLDLLSCDKPSLIHAIKRSCEIKAAIVAADEQEAGSRALLNFGHTFAHAIENGLGYGAWLHGEAVGCGMVMAADLSVRLGLIGRSYAERIKGIVGRAGLPVTGPRLGVERYLELMRQDKKASTGRMRFVVLEAAQRAALRTLEPRQLFETIAATTE